MTKKLFGVIIMSIITVVIWIGHEVSVTLTSEEVEVSYEEYLEPVNPIFDQETIEELKARDDSYMMIKNDELD